MDAGPELSDDIRAGRIPEVRSASRVAARAFYRAPTRPILVEQIANFMSPGLKAAVRGAAGAALLPGSKAVHHRTPSLRDAATAGLRIGR